MKNKKIKTIALAGTFSVACLSTAIISNAGNCKSLFYPAIIKSATKDLTNKELTESYYKLFKESKLHNTLIKEFTIKDFSIEETKIDVTFNILVYSDKVLENEKELYKEELNDLFNRLNTVDNDKNIVFDINVDYEVDDDLKKDYSVVQRTLDSYTIGKSKFDDNNLVIKKTQHSNIPDSWKTRYYTYNAIEESFKSENLENKTQNIEEIDKVFEDEVLKEVQDSLYPEHILRELLYPYEVEKETSYKEDSINSSLYLNLSDNDFSKVNPQKLIDTVVEEVSSDNNINYVSLSIDGKEINDEEVENSSKYYKATLDKTGKVVEYNFE